jgi:hypothetical protein
MKSGSENPLPVLQRTVQNVGDKLLDNARREKCQAVSVQIVGKQEVEKSG